MDANEIKNLLNERGAKITFVCADAEREINVLWCNSSIIDIKQFIEYYGSSLIFIIKYFNKAHEYKILADALVKSCK